MVKNLLKLSALVLSVMALSATARASDDVDVSWRGVTSFRVTGNALVDACSPQADIAAQTACYSYIHGVLDGAYFTTAEGHNLCIPDDVTNLQLSKVIMKYADEHPEQLNHTAFFIVERSVAKAWGRNCK